VKPAAFDYVRPESKAEVLALLAESAGDARVLAGGQSLMALLNMRLVQPQLVIDISTLDELNYVRLHRDRLVVGAAVKQSDFMERATLAEEVPLLAQALPWVGHFQTRNRGTVCGSVAHADPSAELPLCLATLDGEVVLESSRGARTVPACSFFQGVLTTRRQDDELLTEVRFPLKRGGSLHAFIEVAMRHGDFALLALAAVSSADGVRLGVGGVADRPAVRTLPRGDGVDAELNEFAWSLDAQDDQHASAAYRRQLLRELGRKLIEEVSA